MFLLRELDQGMNMEEEECSMSEALVSTIGSTIIAVQEDEETLFLYLDDHQRISVVALEDGGFNINLEERTLH